MDGKSFAGCKMATENSNARHIEDGAFGANGNRCQLFYEVNGTPFKHFYLKVGSSNRTPFQWRFFFADGVSVRGLVQGRLRSAARVSERSMRMGKLAGASP